MTTTEVRDESLARQEARVSAVRRYYSCVDADDVTGLISLFAPDARYRRPGYEPLNGRDELERFYRGERVILQGSHTLTTLVVAENDIAVQGEFSGVLRDGREVSLRFADFFSFGPDNLFSRRDTYFFAPMV
ncbi:MAG TPA: nuclear transport factor 2 family protein [Streptosporangiaceae bacterium]|nr:nuclear transport factor 2 family protein [Streptosporangiaceae bacterium]